jgi:hypothetical protein
LRTLPPAGSARLEGRLSTPLERSWTNILDPHRTLPVFDLTGIGEPRLGPYLGCSGASKQLYRRERADHEASQQLRLCRSSEGELAAGCAAKELALVPKSRQQETSRAHWLRTQKGSPGSRGRRFSPLERSRRRRPKMACLTLVGDPLWDSWSEPAAVHLRRELTTTRASSCTAAKRADHEASQQVRAAEGSKQLAADPRAQALANRS